MRLALFQPDIPQNVGAVIRLTACLGVGLDVIGPCGFPMSDRSLKRAALDYGEFADVSAHDGWTAFIRDKPATSRLILFTTAAEQSYLDFPFSPDDLLLFGRESVGAPPEVHAAADVRLVIPLRSGLRSLNVGTAAAMALGEALRQTGASDGAPAP